MLELDHKAIAASAVGRWVWILCDPWVDGMASRTLLGRMVLGQGSASESTLGSSDSVSVTRCMDGYDSH